jgi:hypothetical protein
VTAARVRFEVIAPSGRADRASPGDETAYAMRRTVDQVKKKRQRGEQFCRTFIMAAPRRHIRVASKQELRDRILTAIDDLNRDPVAHTWTYKLSEAA